MSEVLTDHWSTLGPVLRGKLHIWVGTQDTYYLNEGVKAFQDMVERLSGSTDNAAPPAGQPGPDLSATRGNRWADVSAHSCATRTPAHGARRRLHAHRRSGRVGLNATDALRTESYAETLTFMLATTTP